MTQSQASKIALQPLRDPNYSPDGSHSMTFLAGNHILPKLAAPMFDGDPSEWIIVECGECGRSIETTRSYLLSGDDADLDEERWITRKDDETGKILATCSKCQEPDYHAYD